MCHLADIACNTSLIVKNQKNVNEFNKMASITPSMPRPIHFPFRCCLGLAQLWPVTFHQVRRSSLTQLRSRGLCNTRFVAKTTKRMPEKPTSADARRRWQHRPGLTVAPRGGGRVGASAPLSLVVTCRRVTADPVVTATLAFGPGGRRSLIRRGRHPE